MDNVPGNVIGNVPDEFKLSHQIYFRNSFFVFFRKFVYSNKTFFFILVNIA